jgi:hypothetical protein
MGDGIAPNLVITLFLWRRIARERTRILNFFFRGIHGLPFINTRGLYRGRRYAGGLVFMRPLVPHVVRIMSQSKAPEATNQAGGMRNKKGGSKAALVGS